MNLRSVNSFFEKFWLAVGIGTSIYGMFIVATQGLDDNIKYLLFPLLAFFLFYLRRRMRKSLELRDAKQSEESST
jgi:hypothetical protein